MRIDPPFSLSKISLSITATCVGVLQCLDACAQSSNVESNMPTVLVKSGLIEQKQFDAPASLYAIDANTLASSGPQVNISDVLNRVPGVVALNRNNYAQDLQISIRGFGARAAFGLRGIRVITDGIPATMPDGQGQASTISMPSTDRVEVLTGPLAQLYGNSSGGVIQTFTREAGDTPEAKAQIYAGAFGMTRTDWQFSQRSGNVGLVADYSTFAIQGYRDNSDTRRQQLNSVITVDAQPDTRFKVVVNIFDMPYAKDPLGLTATQLAQNPSQAGTSALSTRTSKTVKQNQIGTVAEHRVNSDLKLQARLYTGTRTNLQFLSSNTWVGLDRRFVGMGLQASGKATVFGQQRMNWVIGTDIDQAREQRQGGSASLGEKIGANTRDELNQANSRDFFAQANWTLGERYTLTTGARQSTVSLKSTDSYITASNPDGSGNVDYKATSPVVGLTWHALDTLNLYINHGKGFETPTMAEAAYSVKTATTVQGQFNPNLLASRSKHLEIGSKWAPQPGTRIDAAAFRIKTEDEIVTMISSNGQSAYGNASQTLRQGFELAMQHQFSRHYRGVASATWMSATYEQAFSSVISGATTSVAAGSSLPAIPKRQWFGSMQWSENGFNPAGRAPALGLEAGLDWVARSYMWANDLNSSSATDNAYAPGYSVFNARVRQRYQMGKSRVEAFVGVDNLTDKATVSSVIVNQSSKQYFEPGLPRAWIIGVQSQIPM